MTQLRITVFALIAAALALSPGCSDDPGDSGPDAGSGPAAASGPKFSSEPLTWEEAVELNNRGVAQLDMGKVVDAELTFRELVARAPQAVEGRVNLAVALLNTTEKEPEARDADYAECEKHLREAMKLDAKNPWGPYCLGILMGHLGRDTQEQIDAFETAHRLVPEDPDTNYRLGAALKTRFGDTNDEADLKRARELLEKSARLQPHFKGAWYSLFQVRRRDKDKAGAKEALDIFRYFEEREPKDLGKTLKLLYDSMGRYANAMRTVAPFGEMAAAPKRARPRLDAVRTLLAGSDGASPMLGREPIPAGSSLLEYLNEKVLPSLGGGLALHDLDGDGRNEIFLADGRGPGRLFRFEGEKLTDISADWGLEAPGLRALGAVFGDIDHDGRPDLYVYGAGPNRLFRNRGQRLEPIAGLEAGNSVTLSAQIADLDHDGDLDLLVGGWLSLPAAEAVAQEGDHFPDAFKGAANFAFNNDRPTIWTKKGTESFSERAATPEAMIESGARKTAALLAFDADRDGDLDIAEIVDGAPGRMLLNDRHWRYRDASARWRMDDAGPGKGVVAADFDRDGYLDLIILRGADAADAGWRNAHARAEEERPALQDMALPRHPDAPRAAYRYLPLDADNDGNLEILRVRDTADGSGLALCAMPDATAGVEKREELALPHFATGLVSVDANGDGLREVLVGGPGGALTLVSIEAPERGQFLSLGLRGKRVNDTAAMWSNHFGIGAWVEVAAGAGRSFHDMSTAGGFLSSPEPCLHIGLGEAEKADYVRIIWPDLVMQNERDLKAGQKHAYAEVNRKASSCPVLFKSNGRGGFDFVADFLGVGGLGFYVGPDLYAPPDETELVRIDALDPDADGQIRLRISEPMEEVCYIDRLALVGIEHPEGTEVYADERLAIRGPVPTGEAFAFRTLATPQAARTAAGEDTLGELSSLDRKYARGVRRDPRFIGYLAEELDLRLKFDDAALRASRPHPDARLILIVEGSVEYPYSHVNYAGTQADLQAESLSIEVGTGSGDWLEVARDVGYPAGMQRAMAIDISEALSGRLDQLRLRTNLELYIDRLRLGWDEGARLTRRRRFAFDRAELRFLGYPLEYSPDGALPTIYDYQRISATSDWKAIAGSFTRYGDVRPLLDAVDDRYVIMNHGDEIALELDASRLPPLRRGQRRTWFLEADGWCKDMDPYTATPETVVPLPYHGMGDYPPAQDYPWDDEKRRWDREWNTRVIENGLAPKPLRAR
jgi:ASPIC and UnbV/FG-GAP-like repeat